MKNDQIQGLRDVGETVKIVEKISASSVHHLKKEVSSLNTYTSYVSQMLSLLMGFSAKKNHPFVQHGTTGIKALIILTSNKGLVGGLWHKMVRTFLQNAERYDHIIVVGTKGQDYLIEENIVIQKVFTHFSMIPTEEEITQVTQHIFHTFEQKVFSHIDMLYPKFVSFVEQEPHYIPLLPFTFLENTNVQNIGMPIFESSKYVMIDSLLQKYIQVFIHTIIMEATLSEFSARTIAMEHAAEKTKNTVKELSLAAIKEKHTQVTQRQLETFSAHQ